MRRTQLAARADHRFAASQNARRADFETFPLCPELRGCDDIVDVAEYAGFSGSPMHASRTLNSAEPTLRERVERALVLVAYLIEMDGDVHVALYERLETELRTLEHRDSVRDRARRLLADCGRGGSSNATHAGLLSLSSSESPHRCLGS